MLRCLRCGYYWITRGKAPKWCANRVCRSVYWNKPRVNGISSKRALRMRWKAEKAAGVHDSIRADLDRKRQERFTDPDCEEARETKRAKNKAEYKPHGPWIPFKRESEYEAE